MKENKIDIQKWCLKVNEFVDKAIDNVKPSQQIFTNSMDYNKFIKIKIIDYKDTSRSEYIDGVVFNKNLANKLMKTHFDNPRILLIKEKI